MRCCLDGFLGTLVSTYAFVPSAFCRKGHVHLPHPPPSAAEMAHLLQLYLPSFTPLPPIFGPDKTLPGLTPHITHILYSHSHCSSPSPWANPSHHPHLVLLTSYTLPSPICSAHTLVIPYRLYVAPCLMLTLTSHHYCHSDCH